VSKPTTTATKPTGSGMTAVVENNSSNKISSDRAPTPDIHHLQLQEEEIIASGWGVDGDDGDGMGML
jgi:RNA-binding protein 26